MEGKLKRHKASREEMCIRHTKERSKLYYQRRRLKKDLGSGKFKGKDFDKANLKLLKLNHKIDNETSKLFKCGKKYAKLKVKKRKLTGKINYLSKVVEEGNISLKDRKAKVKELLELTSELNDLKLLMKMKIKGVKDGSFEVATPEVSTLVSVDNFGFWELNRIVSDIMVSDNYDTVYIDNVKFDVLTQSFEYQALASKIINDINLARSEGKRIGTPRVVVSGDLGKRVVKIYTSEDYE